MRFECKDRIARLFVPNQWGPEIPDITATERMFYETNPFPNYDDTESIVTLIEKARKGIFGKLLDDQTSVDARILEVGCGTGQLCNFLAASSSARTVFGGDMAVNSLKLGEASARPTTSAIWASAI